MELKQAKLCKECNGVGELRTMAPVYQDDIIQAPVGDVMCEHCNGAGEEQDEDIIVERIIENLTIDQENKLEKVFCDEREIGGIPIIKDNCENMFENWLGRLTLEELTKILYE